MTPEGFVAKWRASPKDERRDSQTHFLDLCRLLGVPAPNDEGESRDDYCFEKGAKKVAGGGGFADVWRKGCFGWEYKGHSGDLAGAHRQLLDYAGYLENPPLLIVSDMERITVRTNWTNTVQETHALGFDDLFDSAKRDLLRKCFLDPEALRPRRTRTDVTKEAASRFADLAERLRGRGHEPQAVAHFVNRLVFCLFAEDVGLLPGKLFERLVESSRMRPEGFEPRARSLFAAMQAGGFFGADEIAHFNGGLFDSDEALPLTREDVADLAAAARLDWSEIDPAILGTLFERGLDPAKRRQLGAHYTDREKIMMIVGPVVVEPLLAEWAAAKAEIGAALAAATGRAKAAEAKAAARAREIKSAFLDRLPRFRVLDPACGSGNFLYLSLIALKDLERRVNVEARAEFGLQEEFPRTGPENVKGIEINPYAAELARVSVWIGELQWMRRNGFSAGAPILRKLDHIECRDAILNPDGTRAEWPEADVIVGNPPFLGTKRMFEALGVEYTNRLRDAYPEVSRFSDLVCWWFALANRTIRQGRAKRAGLVATNSIRGGKNRLTLDAIESAHTIFAAWADEPWVVDGAAVRVSLVCFGQTFQTEVLFLDGNIVERIESDLTGGGLNITKASQLNENRNSAFVGTVKGGRFDIDGDFARSLLQMPINPNQRSNRDVIYPYMIGFDIVRRPRDVWVIDFGVGRSEVEAALYEAPFQWIKNHVHPHRRNVRNQREVERWWEFSRALPGIREAIDKLRRFIVTPTLSKHRVFKWLGNGIYPDHQLIAIARDDDTAFGILHSRFHELWSLRMGTWLGVGNDPRYTPSTTFETFPFPAGLTPDIPAAAYAEDPRAQKIAAAAAELDRLREAWLNPADLVRREPEVVPGYPDRILPVSDAAAALLKKRTLTNLYNERPAWLAHAHAALDAAVAEAYGWGEDWRAGRLDEPEILARLFRLNQERAGIPHQG